MIEWLVFSVPVDWVDRFLRADTEVWTAFLQTCPGFLGKQVWRSCDCPEELVLVIQWQTREQWKAIDPAVLAEVARQFEAQVGRSFELRQVLEYGVVEVGGA